MAKINHYRELGITEEAIKRTEKVLEDNGIEADEVQSVLQAIGYSLLDCELYPSPFYPSEDTPQTTMFASFSLTRNQRKLCADAFEHIVDWSKEAAGMYAEDCFSLHLATQYEKDTGKSSLWWTKEGDVDNWRDTLPRDEDFHTNGDTDEYYEYAKKRIAEIVGDGAKSIREIATAIRNRA